MTQTVSKAFPGGPWCRARRAARLLAGVLLIAAALSQAYAAETTVIAHPSFPRDAISQNLLYAVFGMRLPRWDDGTPITVFVLGDRDPTHVAFTKQHLDLLPSQLRETWERLVYTGTGQAPVTVGSPEEMKERVAAIPGGIGYLPSSMVDAHVRALEIR